MGKHGDYNHADIEDDFMRIFAEKIHDNMQKFEEMLNSIPPEHLVNVGKLLHNKEQISGALEALQEFINNEKETDGTNTTIAQRFVDDAKEHLWDATRFARPNIDGSWK